MEETWVVLARWNAILHNSGSCQHSSTIIVQSSQLTILYAYTTSSWSFTIGLISIKNSLPRLCDPYRHSGGIIVSTTVDEAKLAVVGGGCERSHHQGRRRSRGGSGLTLVTMRRGGEGTSATTYRLGQRRRRRSQSRWTVRPIVPHGTSWLGYN
jgi:hypothetical protein